MAASEKDDATVASPSGKSGERAAGGPSAIADRRGGPANFSGVAYQVKVQVHFTLQWIAEHRNDPSVTTHIRCEPRILVDEGQFGYDIGLTGAASRHDNYYEVKRNPSAAEVEDFVARLNQVPEAPGGSCFGLVVESETSAAALYQRLVRLAGEAVDEEELRTNVAGIGDEALNVLLEKVGDNPHVALKRALPPTLLPDGLLTAAVVTLANTVASRGQADALVARLTQRFIDGAQTRQAFSMEQLVSDLVADGLLAAACATVVPAADGARGEVEAVLVVLETSPVPVPVQVLALALGKTIDEVNILLADLVAVDAVARIENGYNRVAPNGQLTAIEFGLDLMIGVLKVITEIANAEKARAAYLTPIAHALTKRCGNTAPEVVANVFCAFDKASKAWGDLWVTFELADVSTNALVRMFGDGLAGDEEKRWGAVRAQTYICGQSWVYQRVDELDEALRYMEKADTISKTYHDDENHAFALKCRGRLLRMQAEKLPAGLGQRQDLLDESARLLESAYDAFDELIRTGRRMALEDRGECIALLARTYATMPDLDLADLEVERAKGLLVTVAEGKASADVTILEAELFLLRAQQDGIELDPMTWAEHVDKLEKLLSRNAGSVEEPLDRPASEIAARAHLVLGQLHERANTAEGHDTARGHYESAAGLYERLRYLAQEKSALWRAMLVSGHAVPQGLVHALDAVEAVDGARLLALRQHLDRTPSTTSATEGTIRLGADPPDGDAYWQGLAADAVARYTASAPSWTEGRAEWQTA